MLLVLGDRDFDVTHRALVVGCVDGDGRRLSGVTGADADAVAVETPSLAADVRDRVDVPVGVIVSTEEVEFSSEQRVRAVGPFGGDDSSRIARVFAAVVGGERVVLSSSVSSDRRVVEVLDRLLTARGSSEGARP